MSLKDKASQIFKPSRYKATTLYAYRGQDLTSVGRASTATRVNSKGLIEEVGINIPRLNYNPSNLSECPSFLFEESITNLSTYSTRLDDLTLDTNTDNSISFKSNATTSPEGIINATKVIYDGSGYSYFRRFQLSNIGVFSVFVKKGNWRFIGVRMQGSTGVHTIFDLDKGEFTTAAYSGHNLGVEKYPNGWFRIYESLSSNYQVNLQGLCFCGSASAGAELPSGVPANSYMYVFGWQLEAGKTIPSSYIPTNGSSVTRAADSDLSIGLSEVGTAVTLYLDYKVKNSNPSRFMYGIFNGNSTSSAPYAAIYQASTQIYNDGTLYTAGIGGNSDGYKKLVIRIDGTSVSYFLNGKEYSANSFTNTLSNPYFLINYGIDKEQQLTEYLIFPDALLDTECVSLTSYDDYQELVDRNDLTWESPTITNNRLTALKEL